MKSSDVFRPANFDALVHEYGLDGRRLLPWDRYPMPFAGGWCVVRPHTESAQHKQIDQEVFIAIEGTATLVVGDRRFAFKKGDIAAIPKHTNHYVINDTDEDFHFYVVWWDLKHIAAFLEQFDETTGCLDD